MSHLEQDHLQIYHDLNISGQIDLYDLAHVAGWEPYDLNDLGHAFLF